MQILILIALGTFLVLSVLFFIFYIKVRNKRDKLASVKNSEAEIVILKKKYEYAFADLIQNKRKGYYTETVNLIDDEKDPTKTKPYTCAIYVKEIDKFTNGESKIQLVDIEVVSGFSIEQYSWIKKCLRERFVTVKPQKEIIWLESEESIKELRKQKLDKLKEFGEKI